MPDRQGGIRKVPQIKRVCTEEKGRVLEEKKRKVWEEGGGSLDNLGAGALIPELRPKEKMLPLLREGEHRA